MTFLLGVLAVVGALAIAAAITSLRVVKEYERGVVYRFGCVITEGQSVGPYRRPVRAAYYLCVGQICLMGYPRYRALSPRLAPSLTARRGERRTVTRVDELSDAR
jgi:hypothetical protein